MADAQDLGSCGQPWGFKSLHPHQKSRAVWRSYLYECDESLRLPWGPRKVLQLFGERRNRAKNENLRQQIEVQSESFDEDAQDLGSCGQPWGFKSLHPHQKSRAMWRGFFYECDESQRLPWGPRKVLQLFGERRNQAKNENLRQQIEVQSESFDEDAQDLGSCGQPWGFKSLHPHQKITKKLRNTLFTAKPRYGFYTKEMHCISSPKSRQNRQRRAIFVWSV